MFDDFIKIAENFSGAIFDLDGTILDSLGAWRDLGAKYLLRFGIVAEKNLDEILFNMSLREGAIFLKEKFSLPKTSDEIICEMNLMLEAAYKNEIALKRGALDALRFCEAKKMRVCAATAGERRLEEAALARCGALDFFEKIFTCGEENTSKSQPEIYLRAARFMALPPQKIIVVEDSREAAKVARDAGFATFLVQGEYEL